MWSPRAPRRLPLVYDIVRDLLSRQKYVCKHDSFLLNWLKCFWLACGIVSCPKPFLGSGKNKLTILVWLEYEEYCTDTFIYFDLKYQASSEYISLIKSLDSVPAALDYGAATSPSFAPHIKRHVCLLLSATPRRVRQSFRVVRLWC